MNPKTLRKTLKDTRPQTISLVGKELAFKEMALEEIQKVYLAKGFEAFNFSVIESDELTPQDLTLLRTEPMMSDHRVVVVKSGAAYKAKQSLGPSTTLVDWTGRLSNAKLEVDCNPLNSKQLKTWLRSQAKARGLLSLDKDEIYLLAETFGRDIRVLTAQLDKLALLDCALFVHLKELCADHTASSVFDLIDACANKKAGAAVDALTALRNQGYPDTSIISAITKNLRARLQFHCGMDVGPLAYRLEGNNPFSEPQLISALIGAVSTNLEVRKHPDPTTLTRYVVKLARR